jgi:16S rRNA U516 pseudouridylate synthase RsuA-like enzyme
MFAARGVHVVSLHRTRFGPWSLDASLAPGQWRAVT